jgi:hypothetical protein
MISPEDESVYSGYLDGELDSLERRAVESALAADPHLAARIRDLATVRELVADLPHPAAPDVAHDVLQRIQSGSVRPRPWSSVRRNLPWLAGALATAAALFLAIIGPRPHQPRQAQAPAPGDRDLVARDRPAGPLDPSVPQKSGPDERAVVAVRLPNSASSDVPARTSPPGDPPPRLAARPAAQTEELDRTRWRSLIDDPRLQRVFLVTDQLGGQAEYHVESIVERTTRQDFYKITVSQGIVIDPRHPDRAVVFAVVLDETQLSPFRDILKQEFKDRLHDQAVDPAVALQLADIGEVVSLPAHPDAKIIIPQEHIAAMQVNNGPTVDQQRAGPVPDLPDSPPAETRASDSPPPSGPIAAQVGHSSASRKDSPRVAQAHSARAAASEIPRHTDPSHPRGTLRHDVMRADDHHLVVLIWVTGSNSGS